MHRLFRDVPPESNDLEKSGEIVSDLMALVVVRLVNPLDAVAHNLVPIVAMLAVLQAVLWDG